MTLPWPESVAATFATKVRYLDDADYDLCARLGSP
jgi:hypothetical protein